MGVVEEVSGGIAWVGVRGDKRESCQGGRARDGKGNRCGSDRSEVN